MASELQSGEADRLAMITLPLTRLKGHCTVLLT
jgi:hypothetical protein